MGSAPKLSIVVDAFNNAGHIEQCLTSILKQSLTDIEIICIDRGSSDNTREIVQNVAKSDNRIAMVSCADSTAGLAFNKGLDCASGDYIHFLSGADYVLDFSYEALYNKLKRYDLDCIKFLNVVIDEAQNTTVSNDYFSLVGLREGDYNRVFSHEAERPLYQLPIEAWTGIYRLSYLNEKGLRFCDLADKYNELFYAQLISGTPRILASLDKLVLHRIDSSVISVQSPDNAFNLLKQSIEASKRMETWLAKNNVDPTINEKLLTREYSNIVTQCDALSLDSTYGMAAIGLVKEVFDATTNEFLHATIRRFEDIQKNAEWHNKRIEEAKRALDQGDELSDDLAELLFSDDDQLEIAKPKPVKVFFEKCAEPKVSVVVPIYNQEEYLNQALHSLSDQLLEEMEFICVNDGSTDGSMTILHEYANIDKRIRIIDKGNTGYGNSMNVGIDAACGEYLGILEPDDFVPPKMYKNLYNIAEKNDLDFVKANFYRFLIDEYGATKKREYKLSGDSSFYKRVVNPSEELDTFKFVMNTWSGIYKLEFLNKWNIRHNETPGASYQDNGFWFQTFARATRAWFAMTPYYMNRRDNPNSSMFDKGKFYAVTNEYNHIEEWLHANPDISEKFEPIFYKKKLSNFIFTYYRLARQYKREYLNHICEEFSPLLEEGKIDEELLGSLYWKMLNDIISDPDDFSNRVCVSVIIPAYNAEKYIGACLNSILSRDEVKTEIICVDDGSTDDTLEILKEYEKRDDRVRVITQENAGAGTARNNGMQYAKGDYLAFLDADDFFEPDMLRRAYEKAYSDEADIVVFRSDNYSENTGTYSGMSHTIQTKLLPYSRPFAGTDIERDVFKAFVGWPWDKLFRAEFIRENSLQFQEQRTTNDLLFVFSAIVKAQRISTMGATLAHHRRLDAGESLSVSRELSWDCFYHALCALRDQLKAWGLYDRFERDFINYALHSSLWNINSLKGNSYHLLYSKLKDEWFEDLGIAGKGKLFFYNSGEYAQLQDMLELDAENYLFKRLDTMATECNRLRSHERSLNGQISTLRKQLRSSKAKAKAIAAEKDDVTEHVERVSEELAAMKAVLPEAKKQAAKKASEKAAKTAAEQAAKKAADEVRRSNSYRIGRAATWLPRKIRKTVKKRRKKR